MEIFVGYFGEIFWEIFVVEENGRKEKDILGKHVVVEEGRNKGKGKRKRNEMRRYFLGLQK